MFRTLRFYHSFFKFLSTPSARRATGGNFPRKSPTKNFYPRPPRGGRPWHWGIGAKTLPISIHALREEGDPSALRFITIRSDFYPRPPRGGRPSTLVTGAGLPTFLSTPSARRATVPSSAPCDRLFNFYPRPPRGGRRFALPYFLRVVSISIHALREEGDRHFCFSLSFSLYFYPRPPRGGRHAASRW